MMNIKIIIPFTCAFISSYSYGQIKNDSVKKADVFAALISIDVSKINTPCGCSDAMERIADSLVKITAPFSSRKEIESDQQAKNLIDLANVKTGQVAERCEKKLGFNDPDIFNCESFKSLKEKSGIVNRKFRNKKSL